jgi:hypothetical protein
MRERKIRFKELPKCIRYGLTLVIFSWFFFLISHSAFSGQISLLHITMGMFVCFAAFSLKNWGRIFTIIYDVFMAVMIGIELHYFIQSGSFTSLMPLVIKGGSILLFVISSAFLLTAEARNFYRGYSR